MLKTIKYFLLLFMLILSLAISGCAAKEEPDIDALPCPGLLLYGGSLYGDQRRYKLTADRRRATLPTPSRALSGAAFAPLHKIFTPWEQLLLAKPGAIEYTVIR